MNLNNDYRPGRPPKPETVEHMNQILEIVKGFPDDGVLNGQVARAIDLSSDRCSTLARRLEDRDLLRIEKDRGALRFFPVDQGD